MSGHRLRVTRCASVFHGQVRFFVLLRHIQRVTQSTDAAISDAAGIMKELLPLHICPLPNPFCYTDFTPYQMNEVAHENAQRH
jgi:hypothetical protein